MGYYVCDKLRVVRISQSIESYDSSFFFSSVFKFCFLSNAEAHVDYMDDIISLIIRVDTHAQCNHL